MSSHSSKPEHPRSAKNDLLDELESIKDLLEESSLDEDELDADLDIDIPILDDVVPGAEQASDSGESALLDLKSIFDDDEDSPDTAPEPELTASTTQASDSPAEFDETQLDFEGLDIDIEFPTFKLSLADENTTASSPDSNRSNENATVITAEDTFPLSDEISGLDQQQPTPAERNQHAVQNDAGNTRPIEACASDSLLAESTADNAAADPLFIDDEPTPELSRYQPEPGEESQNSAPASSAHPSSPHPNSPSPSSPPPGSHNDATPTIDVNIDLLIQEVVDEYIPVIEDELRKRLSSYPADVIRQLAQKHLK